MQMELTADQGKFGFVTAEPAQDRMRKFIFGVQPEKTLRRVLVWGELPSFSFTNASFQSKS